MRIEIDLVTDVAINIDHCNGFTSVKTGPVPAHRMLTELEEVADKTKVVMKDNPSHKQGVMHKSFEQQEESNKKITAEGKTRDEQVGSGKSFTSAITALYVGLRITRPQWKVWYELSAHRVLCFSKKRRGILEQDVVFSLKDVTENDWEIS